MGCGAAVLTGGPLESGFCARKEAWSFYRTGSGVRLCWELEEPKEPKGFRDLEVPHTVD